MAQVGDGAVIYQLGSDAVHTLSRFSTSEYINETSFLTSSNYLDDFYCSSINCEGITALAMMTDGLQMLALRILEKTAHAPFFRTMFQFAGNPKSTDVELAQFLSSDRVCERTDDDKTLLLAVRV